MAEAQKQDTGESLMGINSVEVKSILQKSKLPDSSYVINPYTGCVHGCVYCYAHFMKRFCAHPEPWGTFLDAKVNAPMVLFDQLDRRRRPLKENVFFSSVTDPYQPPENQFNLTRDLLEILLEYQVPVSILTKSDLVLRDMDLFQQFENCSVGLSLMTTDDDLAKKLEPRATPPSMRLETLRTLRENGILTNAFISPFLPAFSDIHELFDALAGAIDEIGVEAINPGAGTWPAVEEVLHKVDPERLIDCKRQIKDPAYWVELEDTVNQLAEMNMIKMTGFYRH